MGFRVWGLGFGVWGLGFGVWGLGFGVWGLGFEVWNLGFDQRSLGSADGQITDASERRGQNVGVGGSGRTNPTEGMASPLNPPPS